jgi:uncharacterized protein
MADHAHLITGGFPPGSPAGHDHDYARGRLLELLIQADVVVSAGADFTDVAQFLPNSKLLITYVAGPYPDAAQCEAIRRWIAAGGHWLGLHGTSGGRAVRVDGLRQRRTVKMEHHALLGSYFLTHPPICEIRVDLRDRAHPITRDLPQSFKVEDEPYFIEVQNPADAHILLTADYGSNGDWPVAAGLYGSDTSLQADGRTRVLGYTKEIGNGGVAYFALGHCHNPEIRGGRAETDSVPATFHGSWESEEFIALLRNAIAWGLGRQVPSRGA